MTTQPEPVATLATWENVQALSLTPLTDAEKTWVSNMLPVASALLRTALLQRGIDVDARIAAYFANPKDPQAFNPDVVANVVAGMVRRVMTNPNGWVSTSSTHTAGAFSESTSGTFSRKDDGTLGTLAVTAEDLRPLLGTTGRSSRPGTITVGLLRDCSAARGMVIYDRGGE